LHRWSRPLIPGDEMYIKVKERSGVICDLLGTACRIEVDTESLHVLDDSFFKVKINAALAWWGKHSEPGTKEQPEGFWKALEAEGKRWLREDGDHQAQVKCVYCGNKATVRRR